MHEGLIHVSKAHKSYGTSETPLIDTEESSSICQDICDFFRCVFCCFCCGSTKPKTTGRDVSKQDPPKEIRNGNSAKDYEDLVNRFTDLTGELDLLREQKDQERRSKEHALSRLSAVAGAKLMHNNPGITDLSDENRPNKLAEKFSELYDNEWTEAFEKEENETFYEEKEGIETFYEEKEENEKFYEKRDKEKYIIAKLLNILKDVSDYCRSLAKRQRTHLQEAVFLSNTLPSTETREDKDYVLKKIKDLQKQTSDFVMDELIQEIHSGDLRKKYEFEFRECRKYVDNCIKLCWLMNIQDPPVFLHFDVHRFQTIDEQRYKHYTISGQTVDFLVWPAMLLYEGGPVLSRGVVQAIEQSNKTNKDFAEPGQLVETP